MKTENRFRLRDNTVLYHEQGLNRVVHLSVFNLYSHLFIAVPSQTCQVR
jgi:hypothetical protein